MKPEIVDEGFEFEGGLLELPQEPIRLIQHHFAADSTIEAVHDYHKNVRGWRGIGYNWAIANTGNIVVGRGALKIGAHSGFTWNRKSEGIAYQGNISSSDLTNEQFESGIRLNAWRCDVFGLTPEEAIIGHGDVANTVCPGSRFPMRELIDEVSKMLNREPVVITPRIDVPVPTRWLELRENRMRGTAVRNLQAILRKLGYDTGENGIYGPKTAASVEAFQRDADILVDGVYGPQTQESLREAASGEFSPSLDLPDGIFRPDDYKRGAENIQRALHRLDYDPGAVDDIYGPKTGAAVRRFQQDAGIQVDSVYGPETKQTMKNYL